MKKIPGNLLKRPGNFTEFCQSKKVGPLTGTDSDGHSDAKYRYRFETGYSTHLHWNRNRNRFSGNSSAHYYISHLNQNRNRNRSRGVETHHKTHLLIDKQISLLATA